MKKLSYTLSSTSVFLLFCLLFGLLMAQATPVHAATISVDTFDDDVVDNGNCTLREAIMAAESDTAVDNCTAGDGADTITLMDGTYTLTAVDNVFNGHNGLPKITTDITIMGNGAIIARDGMFENEFRFFYVALEASLTLNNLALENGYVGGISGEDGGAIYNVGTLRLENQSKLSSNFANSFGGAIVNTGSVTIDNSFIADSYAYEGGGIFNDDEGTVTILNNSEVAGNSAVYSGGGIQNYDSLLTIDNSLIAENIVYGESFEEEAQGQSDGLDQLQYVEEEYLSGYGGGIYTNYDATITNSTIRDNEAPYGGGIANIYGDLDLSFSTVSGNMAMLGGGIYTDYSEEWIYNATISGNIAEDGGGGLYLYGSYTTLDFVTIAENIADANGDYYGVGGGIYAGYASVEVTNSIIAQNVVDNLEPYGVDCFDDGGMGGGEEEEEEYGSAFVFVAFTLVGDNAGCEVIVDGDSGNITGSTGDVVNPALTPLGDFGGPTLTHSLLLGSVAIDAADPTCAEISDQRGFARPEDGDNDATAVCDMGAVEVSYLNDAWPRARRIILTEEMDGLHVGSFDMDSIDELGQSRWYKFSIDPQSDVMVDLTELAANYDITLYKDIAQEYAELSTLESEEDLLLLSAEFAPDAYSPDIFSPDIFSPDIFSPDIFSPDIFSPDIFSPDIFSPDIFSPDIFSPDIFSPDIFSPDIFSPDIFSPDIFSPDIFSPDIFSPDPTIYSSAQLRSLIGVSALESTAPESISVRSWDNDGDFYVRVRGRYGAFAPNEDFTIDVQVQDGGCAGYEPSTVPFDTVPTAGDFRTIILVDYDRMNIDSTTPQSELETAVNDFADRTDIQGVVVRLDQDQRIIDANAKADEAFDCPHAKNVLADDIKSIIDGYWELNPLEYVVIIGNDNVIPFYRHPDQALLANESNYVPPVADNTASQASLRLGYVLGQDRYGSRVEVSLRSDTLTIPELAVGRLVETSSDVINMFNAFEATNGTMPTPQSSFITGYDFLEDAAEAVQTELELGIGNPANTLITPAEVSPMDSDNPLLWSADDLRNEFLTQRHDVVYLAGHFSAFSALAADYETRMLASELADSTVDMTNTLVFSTGCHSGYNTVNEHGIPNITVEPDWAQAFAQKGSTLIAGTGYQYGDTDFIEYNERLYRDFAMLLRAGSGPVSIGNTLVEAKGVYLANTPELRPLHEKSLLEVTLFGLPMMMIDMPSGRNPDLSNDSIINSTTPVTTDPGATLGLETADVTLGFDLDEVETELTDATDASNSFIATHYEGSDGVVPNTSEPVLPLESRNVGVEDMVLRGVGFRGGSYGDTAGLLPLTGAATTELRSVHAPFLAEAFFPVKPYDANYIDALMHEDGGATNLMMTPAQYISDGPLSTTGTWRTYDDMSFRLFYSDNIITYGENVPALANPPAITTISAQSDGGDVNFAITVQGDPSAGIQEVWVTYTSSDGSFANEWQSLDLTQDSENSFLWTGTLPLAGNTPANMRYIVQAANGVGGVSLAANGGFYYTPDDDPDPTAEPTADETSLTFVSVPSVGTFGDDISVTAELSSLGSPVEGEVVSINLGGQTRMALTGADGRITVTIPLLSIPGETEITATYGGSDALLPSFSTSAFTLVKQSTFITVEPDPASAIEGEDSGMMATLKDALDRPLPEKSLFFIVSGNGEEIAFSIITDYIGQAPLGIVDLPEGSYTVDVYFSGDIPLSSGVLTLDDVRYLPSSTTATLEIGPENNAPVAVDDEAMTVTDTAVTIDVLANDSDVDEDPLTVISVTMPLNGTAVINSDNSITYTPDAGFEGIDAFDYTIDDGNGGTDTATVTVTVDPAAQDPMCDPNAPGVNVIYGTPGDDLIRGTNGDDVIYGLEGNDRILGRNGNDCIEGGPGDDELQGGNGNDLLIGNEGDDTLVGNNGSDEAHGGSGNDEMFGDNGTDTLFGNDGNDTIFGGNGDDMIDGGAGDDELGGQNGDDIIFGDAGDDDLKGDKGDDYLDGGDDVDNCVGGKGSDTAVNCEVVINQGTDGKRKPK